MRRDKNFKLSKQTKRYMATMVDPLKRSHYKNAMIEAELTALQLPPKYEKKKKHEAQAD